MFNYVHETKGNVEVAKIWGYYENVALWKEWDHSISNVELHGNFADGSTGMMYFADSQAPPLKFVLVDVIKDKQFTAVAELGEIKVQLEHYLIREDNETAIKHAITVEGPDENMIKGIGHNLTKDLPEYIENLFRLAQ